MGNTNVLAQALTALVGVLDAFENKTLTYALRPKRNLSCLKFIRIYDRWSVLETLILHFLVGKSSASGPNPYNSWKFAVPAIEF